MLHTPKDPGGPKVHPNYTTTIIITTTTNWVQGALGDVGGVVYVCVLVSILTYYTRVPSTGLTQTKSTMANEYGPK